MTRLWARWQGIIGHPLIQLELRRVRRRRWWPGRRALAVFAVLVGVAYGCVIGSVVLLVTLVPVEDLIASGLQDAQWPLVVVGTPTFCLISGGGWLVGALLPWLAPALTAAAIAGERELGSFDLLRTTLLTDRSLVLGKLGGCLVRLWPALVVLALLTPARAVVTLGSGLDLFALVPMSVGGEGDYWVWVVLALAILRGMLLPWVRLALHAAIGLFVSTLSRSAGNAIALAYSAILVLRVGMWFVSAGVLALGSVPLASLGFPMAMAGLPLGSVAVEFGGALLLVQAAVWRLRRV